MSGRQTISVISGSVQRPSRTSALVAEIASAIAARGDYAFDRIELIEAAPHLFSALHPRELKGEARRIVDTVERADLLVVGTPVYRASMTGALKHLFDLVDHRAFPGKPVVLAATGGTLMHGLVTEHQLRPLFGFLNALTLPTTVYAVEPDFDGYTLASAKVRERVARAAEEAVRHLRLLALEAASAHEQSHA